MIGRFVVWVILAVACSMFIKIMLLLDLNKKQFSHVPGPCRYIKGIEHGAEDMEVVDDTTVLITSGLKFSFSRDIRENNGRIYMLDLKETENGKYAAKPLTIEGGTLKMDEFNPQGITSYTSKSRVNVYIVNHGTNGDSVESFILNKQKRILKHTKSIVEASMTSVNNLVAVGPDRFFFTNDGYFRNKWLRMIEVSLLCNFGNVVYYDGRSTVVDNWLHFPNGIALSKDKKHMYVSLSGSELIRIYNVSRDMSLIKNADMGMLSSPDNIFVDKSTGDLWIAAHPVMYELLEYMVYPQRYTAPSQVLHIRMQGDAHDRWVLTEAYSNQGDLLKAASSAVFYKDQMLIGSSHDKLMHCQVSLPDIT